MCICMGTKTISIMDDAYNILLRKKQKEESFSDVIRRIAGNKKDIMNFAGAWKDLSDKDTEVIKKTIMDLRKNSTLELKKKIKENDMHRL